MAALTADKMRDYTGEYKKARLPVAASTKLFTGALACNNAAGNLVPASDTANLSLRGVIWARIDNTTGAAGDKMAEYQWGQVEKLAINGVTLDASDIGKDCFVFDDQTVTDSATAANDVKVGRIQDYTAGFVFVEIGIFSGVNA